MSKQVIKKNIALNNESFVAAVSGSLVTPSDVVTGVAPSPSVVLKTKLPKKNTLAAIEEESGVEELSEVSPELLLEDVALVDGVNDVDGGDVEISLTQSRAKDDGAASFWSGDSWNVVGGILLLGGVVALAGGGGGGSAPVCNDLTITDSDDSLELTSDLRNVGDITVTSFASADVSLSTTSADIVLCDHGDNNLFVAAEQFSYADVDISVIGDFSDIKAFSMGNSSEVDLNLALEGGINGDIFVVGAGDSADINVDIYATESINAGLRVVGTDDSSVYVDIDTEGQFNGNVLVTDNVTLASSDAEWSFGNNNYIQVSIDAEGGFTGDVTVAAYGLSSDIHVSIDVDEEFNLVGDMTLSAIGEDSHVMLSLDTDGSFIGDITATAVGLSSDIDVSVDADVSLIGNITATAEGVSSDIEVSVEVDEYVNVGGGGSSDTDTGDVSYSVVMDSDVVALASGLNADVDLELDIDMSANVNHSGDIDSVSLSASYTGDITMTALGEDSDIDLELDVTTYVDSNSYSSDLDDETAVSLTASYQGNITATANGIDSNIDLDIVLEHGYCGDINPDLLTASANFIGDISLTASGSGSDISMDLWVEDDLTGNITMIASGTNSNIYAGSNAPWNSSDIEIGDNFTGNLTATASGVNSGIYLSMDVGGDINGDLTFIASGISSSIDVSVEVDGDINGNIVLRADTSLPDYAHEGSDVQMDLLADKVNGDIYIQSANLEGSSLVDLDIHLTSGSADISEQVIGDIFVSGGYSNDVEIAYDQLFSDRISMTGGGDASVGSFATDRFYGELNLDINAANRTESYQYWFNAINEESGEMSDLHNRFITIDGFTGINADEDRLNDMDFIEFGSFGYDDNRYDLELDQDDGDGGGYHITDLFEDGGSFTTLQEFFDAAHDNLAGGYDDYYWNNSNLLYYDAVQFYAGNIGNDTYLAIGSSVQSESGMSYLVKFTGYEADSSWLEYQLQNVQYNFFIS